MNKLLQELCIDDLSYEWLETCQDSHFLKRGIELIEEDGNYFIDLKKSIENKLKTLDSTYKQQNEKKNNISNEEKQTIVNDLNNWTQKKSEEKTPVQDYNKLAEIEKTKGNEALLAKDYKEAIKYYDLSLKLNPNNHLVHSNKAQAYLQLKDFKNAIKEADMALKLEPDFIKAYYRRAKGYEGLKEYYNAALDYEEILKREKDNTLAQKNLAQLQEYLSESQKQNLQNINHQQSQKIKIEIEECSEEEECQVGSFNESKEDTEFLERKNNLCKQLIQNGNFIEAIEIYKALLQDLQQGNPYWLTFKSNLCHCYKQDHNDKMVLIIADEIIYFLKDKGVEQNQDIFVKTLLRRAFSLERIENFKEALLSFGIVKTIQPFNIQAVQGVNRNKEQVLHQNSNFDFFSFQEKIEKTYKSYFKTVEQIQENQQDQKQEKYKQQEPKQDEKLILEENNQDQKYENQDKHQDEQKQEQQPEHRDSFQEIGRIQQEKITEIKEEGNSEFKQKNYQKAIELYTKALAHIEESDQMCPQILKIFIDILSNRSLAHHYNGTYLLGLKDAEKALQYKIDDPKLFYRAAKNTTSMAEELFQKVLVMKDLDIQTDIIDQTNDKVRIALDYIQKVLSVDPSNTTINQMQNTCNYLQKVSSEKLETIKKSKQQQEQKLEQEQQKQVEQERLKKQKVEQEKDEKREIHNQSKPILKNDLLTKTNKIAEKSRQQLLQFYKPPQNATEFETHLKAFDDDYQSAYKFLLLTDPILLQNFYKKSQIEVPVLMKIIDIFNEAGSEEEEELEIMFNYLKEITTTKSFKLTMSMILKKEKHKIENLLEKIELILLGKVSQVKELKILYKIKQLN